MRSEIYVLSVLVLGCAPAATTSTGTARGQPDRVIVVDDRAGASVRSPNDPVAAAVKLPATADQVFSAVSSSFAMLKIPITYTDRNLGEQGNKKFIMSRRFDSQPVSTYLNCGNDPFGGPNADVNPVTVSIVTRARPSGGTGTVLETMISGLTFKGGASSGPIYCASTGELEQHLAEMVASRLSPGT